MIRILLECLALEDNPNCEINGTTCIEGPETRNINGLDVHKDCWRWENTYTCASGSPTQLPASGRRPELHVIQIEGALIIWIPGNAQPPRKNSPVRAGTPHTSTVTTCGSPPDGDFAQATAMTRSAGKRASIRTTLGCYSAVPPASAGKNSLRRAAKFENQMTLAHEMRINMWRLQNIHLLRVP